MNRSDFQQLAHERLRDAEALLRLGHWSGAYYLAVYAVECALKACIAKLTKEYEYPDKERTQKSYSHKMNVLIEAAGLLRQRTNASAASGQFDANWQTVCLWEETSRYQMWSEQAARDLFEAVADPIDGVFAWITGLW